MRKRSSRIQSQSSYRRLPLINHPVNKGYGAALVTGFESVTKELAFFMDADGQFDIRDLTRFSPSLKSVVPY
jgi:glycosyltransferase involved in cell wall biosynthesis